MKTPNTIFLQISFPSSGFLRGFGGGGWGGGSLGVFFVWFGFFVFSGKSDFLENILFCENRISFL